MSGHPPLHHHRHNSTHNSAQPPLHPYPTTSRPPTGGVRSSDKPPPLYSAPPNHTMPTRTRTRTTSVQQQPPVPMFQSRTMNTNPPAKPTAPVSPDEPWRHVGSTYSWVLSQEKQQRQSHTRIKRVHSNRKTEKWVQEQATYYVSVPVDGRGNGDSSGKENEPQRWHVNAGIEMRRVRARNLWNDVVERWIKRQGEKETRRVEREIEREKERERVRERERAKQLLEEEARARAQQRQREEERIRIEQARIQQQLREERRRMEQEKADAEARRARHRARGYAPSPAFYYSPYPGRSASVDPERSVADAWRRYEAGWEPLTRSSSSHQPAVTFASIPWPMTSQPLNPESITASQIASFIFSPLHSQDQSRKERLRNAQLRWHPDRFRRIMGRVVEGDKVKVEEGVGIVARCLNDLMAQESNKAESMPRTRARHRSETK